MVKGKAERLRISDALSRKYLGKGFKDLPLDARIQIYSKASRAIRSARMIMARKGTKLKKVA